MTSRRDRWRREHHGLQPDDACTLFAAQLVLGQRLDAEVTRPAASIAYIDDFSLMIWVTLCAVPLLLLLRQKKVAGTPAPAMQAVAD